MMTIQNVEESYQLKMPEMLSGFFFSFLVFAKVASALHQTVCISSSDHLRLDVHDPK
jgi:hypothetical protein